MKNQKLGTVLMCDGGTPDPDPNKPPAEPAGGKSEGSEVEGETFYDAKKVPEALRPSFIEMQTAYRGKTTSMAEKLKVTEAFEKKSKAFDEIMGDEKISSFVNKQLFGQGGEDEPTPVEEGEDREAEKKDKVINDRMATLEEKILNEKYDRQIDRLEGKYSKEKLGNLSFEVVMDTPEFNELLKKGYDYEDAYKLRTDPRYSQEAKDALRSDVRKDLESEVRSKVEIDSVGQTTIKPREEKTKGIRGAADKAIKDLSSK